MTHVSLPSPNGNVPGMTMRPAKKIPVNDVFQFDQSELPGIQWLLDFEEWMGYRASRSHPKYARLVSLWLLSTVALGRVHIESYKRLNTVLFLTIVGQSGAFNKTSAANQAKVVMRAIDSELADFIYLAANQTPQKFIKDLAGKEVPQNWNELPDSQRAKIRYRLAWGETRSKFFSEAGGDLDRMARGSEYHQYLRQLADGEGIGQDTIIRGVEQAKNAYCALLFDLTYNDIKPHASAGHKYWHNGFWSRFIFAGSGLDDEPITGVRNKNAPIPDKVLAPLINWHNRLGRPQAQISPVYKRNNKEVLLHEVEVVRPEGHTVYAPDDSEGRELLESYHDWCVLTAWKFAQNNTNEDLSSSYSRLTEWATKIAGLLASMNGEDEITLDYAQAGISIAEEYRFNLHEVYQRIQNTSGLKSDEDSVAERIMIRLVPDMEGSPLYGPQSTRNLLRNCKLTRKTHGDVLDSLIADGYIADEKEGRTNKLSLTDKGRGMVV